MPFNSKFSIEIPKHMMIAQQVRTIRLVVFIILVCVYLLSGEASGQFTTVLNIPPDPNIGDRQSIGSNTQLNLFTGGSIGLGFDAGTTNGGPSYNVEVNIIGGLVGRFFEAAENTTVNISGGTVGDDLHARLGSIVNITGGSVGDDSATSGGIVNISGGLIGRSFESASSSSVVNISGGSVGVGFKAGNYSTVNISGGSVGDLFRAVLGGVVNISGGSVGDRFQVFSNSSASISGGEFRLDGTLISGLDSVGDTINFDLPSNSVLSGTLADGTPFAFSSSFDLDSFAEGTLTLQVAVLPVIGPSMIMVPSDIAPLGIRSGQTITVGDNGILGDHFNAGLGSVTNVTGGLVGNNFEATGALLTIINGSVGDRLDAFNGSTVNISGGLVGDDFDASNGTIVNISGGSVGGGFSAFNGSTVNISGGFVGPSANASESTFFISGGSIGALFRAENNSTVNIAGGKVAASFDARSSSTVNISDGSVGSNFDAFTGSVVDILGGSIGDDFDASAGSAVQISGGEFRLDNTPISGLEVEGNTIPFELLTGSVLSGTLANGTPFSFSSLDSDSFGSGTLTLKAATLPVIGPATIQVLGDTVLLGIRGGQTMIVEDGGVVNDHFNAGEGSVVNINGGQVGDNFEAVGSLVTIEGGSVGDDFDAMNSSTVNILSGAVGRDLAVSGGSIVNVLGGSVGRFLDAYNGGTLNISGGSVGSNMEVHSGGAITVSGGTFGDRIVAITGSKVRILGGEFRLNGTQIDELDSVGDTLALEPFFLPDVSVLSGTLTDGTPFAIAFSPFEGGFFSNGTLTLETTSLPVVGPAMTVVPNDPAPLGIRSGQTMYVDNGGVVGDHFNAGLGSVVHVTGGQVGVNFEAVGALVTISGGSVGDEFDAMDGSTVNISGGSIGEGFGAFSGSTVNLFGTLFVLDGLDISGTLMTNVPVQITERNVSLEGLLADGSPFSFDLNELINSSSSSLTDFFDPNAFLTITLISPGDFNGDGQVNGVDFLKWQRGESPNPLSAADLGDWEASYGKVDFLATNSKSVPEPSASLLATIICLISISSNQFAYVNRI